MISHKVPAARSDTQNEKCTAAILEILDEEIDLQTPNQVTEDSPDELELLVTDFLKHLATEPDQP